MKIGIILEGKNPPDKRVPFTPAQCRSMLEKYPQIDLTVERSPIRAFSDEEYEDAGIKLSDDLSDRDVIFGVKEVNSYDLLAKKTYFFFSHTIKKQPYNRELLQTILKRKITLIDYECLTHKKGGRLVGFGRYAGIVGCYNAFIAYGKRSNAYSLKPAHQCDNRLEMEKQFSKIKLPNNYKIALTGLGRVAGGAIEVLTSLGIRRVSPQAFLEQQFDEPVYTQLSVEEYFEKKDGTDFERQEAHAHAERFDSVFYRYAGQADMYIPCHYWDSKGPLIFSKEEMKSPEFKIRVIADISCDIDGPIPSTIRPSTIPNPIYHYDIQMGEETNEIGEGSITVMAVDNLPCELPKDASEDFGKELLKHVLPCLFESDPDNILERACIAKKGKLGSHFSYLEDYVKGKD